MPRRQSSEKAFLTRVCGHKDLVDIRIGHADTMVREIEELAKKPCSSCYADQRGRVPRLTISERNAHPGTWVATFYADDNGAGRQGYTALLTMAQALKFALDKGHEKRYLRVFTNREFLDGVVKDMVDTCPTLTVVDHSKKVWISDIAKQFGVPQADLKRLAEALSVQEPLNELGIELLRRVAGTIGNERVARVFVRGVRKSRRQALLDNADFGELELAIYQLLVGWQEGRRLPTYKEIAEKHLSAHRFGEVNPVIVRKIVEKLRNKVRYAREQQEATIACWRRKRKAAKAAAAATA